MSEEKNTVTFTVAKERSVSALHTFAVMYGKGLNLVDEDDHEEDYEDGYFGR